jgi:Outer membrane protein beta-barrel domain
MKKLLLAMLSTAAISSVAFAGETYSGKEMKQVAVPPPCPVWYADREFNVGIWGTYVFTGNSWENDRYLEADHVWGGGGSLKYFFTRNIGVGVEGWAGSARQALGRDLVIGFPSLDEVDHTVLHENNVVGSILGTLTFRYPISCSQWAPYAFVGGGGIFGGSRGVARLTVVSDFTGEVLATETRTKETEARAVGLFGAGVEFRFTPHIGWTTDFSWNVVDGPNNNFGMVRSGLNFAF